MEELELLRPERFEDPADGYGFQRIVFDQISSGERQATLVITPSSRHVGVTKRDTHRPGFREAVRAADSRGFPVFVRGAGGGATAAGSGTFGFSIVRPQNSNGAKLGDGIRERYDESAALALGAFARIGAEEVEVGEVRDEFCPGDHSLRIGGWRDGMKIVGIAQRVTRRAASVGGIVLVEGEDELARVLEGVYSAMDLPFRRTSVGSLNLAGHRVSVERVVEAFAEEAARRYAVREVEVDEETKRLGREVGGEHLVAPDPV